jgi:tetratricopeptide (TPR) repeat protein
MAALLPACQLALAETGAVARSGLPRETAPAVPPADAQALLDGDNALQCRLVASSIFGAIYREKAEYDRAIERFRAALKLALRSGDGKAVANETGRLGAVYACAGETETALQFLNTCMVLSERISYWPGIQFAYWHIDRLLEEKGNKTEARKFLDIYSSRYPELRNLR